MFSRRDFIKNSAALAAVRPTVTLLSMVTATEFVTGCNAATIAQDIVNWTPALESTAATAASTASILLPADALLITAALLAFNAAANLVSSEAKAYLANPGASTLSVLQTAVITFQQNVSAAFLDAAKISDTKTQQVVTTAINGVATVITSILSLITQIKGNTVSTAAVKTSLNQIRPIIDRPEFVAQSNRIIQAHYHNSYEEAHNMYCDGITKLQAEGF